MTSSSVPSKASERGLELLDGGQVEVVRRLVEHQPVRAGRHQQRQARAGALAGRERRRAAADGVAAEAELGQQRARLLHGHPAARRRSRRAASRRPRTRGGPGRARRSARPGRPSASRPRARGGRAGPRPASSCPMPLGPTSATRSPQASSRSSGPSVKLPRRITAPSSRAVTRPGALPAAEAQLQLPAPPRLVGDLQALERALGRLDLRRLLLRPLGLRAAHVLVGLVLDARLRLAHARLRPLALAPRAVGEPVALGRVDLVALLGVARRGGAQLEVAGPAAAVLRRGVRDLVDLQHPRDGALEEGAVVGDDHGAARALGDEALQPGEAVEVEVVGGLVEQQDAEAGEQDRGERRAGRLPAGERGGLAARAGRGRGRARGRPPRARGSRSAPPRPSHSSSACEYAVLGAGLGRRPCRRSRGPCGRARRRRRCAGRGRPAGSRRARGRAPAGGSRRCRRSASTVPRSGASTPARMPQQRRLAGAVRADDAEHVAGRDGHRDAAEHGVVAVGLDDVARDQSAGVHGLRLDGATRRPRSAACYRRVP